MIGPSEKLRKMRVFCPDEPPLCDYCKRVERVFLLQGEQLSHHMPDVQVGP